MNTVCVFAVLLCKDMIEETPPFSQQHDMETAEHQLENVVCECF